MSLAPGTRVGSFEIVAKLGEGGMGEVYRARAAALNRDVAIKVLPDAAIGDAERRARFSREAQALAALNHPNIAHIYGFEGQANALVMELIEGQDLSELIASYGRSAPAAAGPSESASRGTAARGGGAPRAMSIEDALHIARQIADALEAAHEQGIVHRDLKPANIKVKPDGTVKVLDFGLAKVLSPETSGAPTDTLMNSPTLTARATQLGVILGTAAYMSPEQAKGKPVDKRADIWAFGVVLYEMLTGRRAFEGEDISTTLAHVLMKDPEWAALPAGTPPGLRMLVERCLERDVRMRLRDIGEARVMLARPEALRGSVADAPAAAPQLSPRRSSWWVWAMAPVVVAAAALAGAWGARQFRATPGDQPALRYSITTPAVGSPMVLPSFALSPDGRYLVYAGLSPSSGSTVLWVRPTNELSGRQLPGTEGASGPFWAPDNRRIGFAAAGKLKITAIEGGLPTPVCDYPTGNFLGGAWNADGTILMSISSTGANYLIARVSEHGGAVSDVVKPDQALQQTSLYWPFFLSDGRHFVYTAWSNTPERRGIFLGSLDGGPPALLIQAPSAGIVASGFLLYVNDGQLLARAFDGTTLQSEARKLADDVTLQRMSGRMAVTASQTGVLAFRSGTSADPLANLVWLNRSGQQLSVIGKAAPINQVRLSPDERRVAITLADPRTALYNVHVVELSNNIISQVTFEESSNDPMWGPDSQTVAFEALPKGKRDFYSQVIGTRTTTPIYVADADPKWIDDWSRDGQFMLFHLPPPCKLFALSLKGDRKPFLLAESTKNIDAAHFSNDGKWVAYGNNESGTYEVWVAAFPAFDHRHQVSSQGGSQPWFRGDGRELFYLTLEGKLMSVGITTDAARSELMFATPELLFQSPLSRSTPTIDQYAVTRDGQRFVFVRPLQEDLSTATAPITVVANWIQAIK